jgi:hypothetical protein
VYPNGWLDALGSAFGIVVMMMVQTNLTAAAAVAGLNEIEACVELVHLVFARLFELNSPVLFHYQELFH